MEWLFLDLQVLGGTLTYIHLSQCERYQIQALEDNNLNLRHIAKQLERSASTIAREIHRLPKTMTEKPAAATGPGATKARCARQAGRFGLEDTDNRLS